MEQFIDGIWPVIKMKNMYVCFVYTSDLFIYCMFQAIDANNPSAIRSISINRDASMMAAVTSNVNISDRDRKTIYEFFTLNRVTVKFGQ